MTAGDLAGSMWFHNEDIDFDEVSHTYIDVWKMADEPPGILGLPSLYYDPKILTLIIEPLSPLPFFLEWYCAWIDRCLLNFEGPK